MSTEPGEHMFAEERKQKIVDYVNEHQKAKVPELCQEFNVSSATIRNDLRDLENSGALMRTHGGAMRNMKTGYESVMAERSAINLEGKKSIAARAIECIENNDTIILDVGTTTLELARLIHRRRNITVITNDLKIALVLEDVTDCTIVMLGGVIRKQYHSTIGPTPIEFLEDFVVDKAFMGTNSFSLDNGATTPDLMQAQVKKKMIQIAGRVYLLCEGEKLGRSSFAQFAEVEDIDVIITDSISDETRSQYEENGFDVIAG
jgi:DeoR family fructose operon transcriptional repressor